VWQSGNEKIDCGDEEEGRKSGKKPKGSKGGSGSIGVKAFKVQTSNTANRIGANAGKREGKSEG